MPLEKVDIFNAQNVYREIGLKLGRLEQSNKSLKYFDASIERNADDIRTLRGRAVNRACIAKYYAALKDIDTMVQNDPDNIYVSSIESYVKYLCGEFEDALVKNTRKARLRQKPRTFVWGKMHCEDAILNNIGTRAGHPLRDHFKIIRKLAWNRTLKEQQPYEPKISRSRKKAEESTVNQNDRSIIQTAVPKNKIPDKKKEKKSMDPAFLGQITIGSENELIRSSLHSKTYSDQEMVPPIVFPFKPIQAYTTNIDNLIAERYLGKMYQDKIFMKRLQNHSVLQSSALGGIDKVRNHAKKSSNYISNIQEILRSRRPFYFIRLQDSQVTEKVRKYQTKKDEEIKKLRQDEAESMLSDIRKAVANEQLQDVILISHRLFTFCEKTVIKYLPKRESYLFKMCTLARDAFYNTRIMKISMSDPENIARVAIGLPKEEQGSPDIPNTQCTDLTIDTVNLCKLFEERVRKARKREILIWLYYELSRLNFELKSIDLAKAYAVKCVNEAKSHRDMKWIINSMFLSIKGHIAHRNDQSAKIELKICLNMAKKMSDANLEYFTEKCLEVIYAPPAEAVPSSKKLIDTREKQIMHLLKTDKLKHHAKLVFQRISNAPLSRKMCILPGITYVTKDGDPIDEVTGRISSKNPRTKYAPTKLTKKSNEDISRGFLTWKLLENEVNISF